MRLAGTAVLLVAWYFALPLRVDAIPILDAGDFPAEAHVGQASSRGNSQAPIDLSGLPSAINAPNFGTQHAPGLAPAFTTAMVVPEPGTFAILILGLGLLLVARKRRARTQH